jgi:hypothetical protein
MPKLAEQAHEQTVEDNDAEELENSTFDDFMLSV